MTDYKRPESVLVVIYDEDNHILLLKRSDDSTFWQSVTGSLFEDELPVDAAKRELNEETGLTMDDGKLVDCKKNWWFTIFKKWLHRYPPGTQMNLEHVFLFKTQKKHIKMSGEHLEYLWLPKELALKRVTSVTNFRAIYEFIT